MAIDLLQNTLDGLSIGAAYALIALGFTLIFGVLRRVNLSYGPAIMLGTYCATWIAQRGFSGLLLLACVTVAGSVLAGAYVERLCFAPHAAGGRWGRAAGGPGARAADGGAIASMVASFALWMQLEEVAVLWLPQHLYAFPALVTAAPIAFAGLSLRPEALPMLACAALVCAGLWWLLTRTRFGLSVRAVVDHADAARLSGIDVARVFVLVFALASAIGGLAGFMVSAGAGQVTPMLGMWSTLKGMIAMMIGGLGSLPGAVLGALLLGQIEAHAQWFVGPLWRDLVTYGLLFALLALRPAGLWSLGAHRAPATS
jgi:branched-chain amino acid transport system permease protein